MKRLTSSTGAACVLALVALAACDVAGAQDRQAVPRQGQGSGEEPSQPRERRPPSDDPQKPQRRPPDDESRRAKPRDATGIFLNSPVAIFLLHSAGPVVCTLVPLASTATVTGMSTTSNS